MGERKLAPVKAMNSVALACQEATEAKVEAVDETLLSAIGRMTSRRPEEDLADHHA